MRKKHTIVQKKRTADEWKKIAESGTDEPLTTTPAMESFYRDIIIKTNAGDPLPLPRALPLPPL